MSKVSNISAYTIICLLFMALWHSPARGSIVIEPFSFVVTDTIPQLPDNKAIVDTAQNEQAADEAQQNLVSKQPRSSKKKLEDDKKERPTKLETYVFTDSTLKAKPIFAWRANHYFNNVSLTRIDTLISENKTELPFYKNDVGVTYLGPTGSATLLHNYFKHTSSDFFPFFDPYSEYTRTPDEVVFYNTKTPYSDLSYHTSGSKRVSEDNLKVLYTVNVLPALNIGLSYTRFGAKGIYENQGTRAKSLALFTSYTGKRYVAHGGFLYNSINNQENGGLLEDRKFTDTIMDAGAINVNLTTARNKLRNNTFFLTHSYGLPIEIFNKLRDSTKLYGGGTMVYFGHSFEYTRYNRVYTDGPADTLSQYFDRFYVSKSSSFDSTSSSFLNNKLYMKLQPWSSDFWISEIDGGLGYRFEKYYVFTLPQYLYGKKSTSLSTGYIYGSASGVFKKYFRWNAFLNYHFAGYRQNDLLFDVTAKASVYPLEQGVHLEGRFTFDNREPAYFSEHYFSNHVKWDKNFNKTQTTKIQASLSIPDWDMEAGFHNALVNQPIYFDTIGIPQQSSDIINITALYLQKNFRVGVFHFDHRLLMQLTSNSDVIPLPLFSGNLAYYFQTELVKSVLDAQFGFDIYYNTNFYDYAYNPAVGMFHTQNTRQLGNYPWVDLFANFKWKRVNFYIKMTNFGEGIIGQRDFFSALHYPRNNRMFRIGIRWHFFT